MFTCSSYCGTYCRRRAWWGLPTQPTERRRSEWLRLSTPGVEAQMGKWGEKRTRTTTKERAEDEPCSSLTTMFGKKGAGLVYLCVVQFLPFRSDEIKNAVGGSGERHPSDQKDDQDHVGKCGCEINHLSRERWQDTSMKEKKMGNKSNEKVKTNQGFDGVYGLIINWRKQKGDNIFVHFCMFVSNFSIYPMNLNFQKVIRSTFPNN